MVLLSINFNKIFNNYYGYLKISSITINSLNIYFTYSHNFAKTKSNSHYYS